MLLGYFTHTHIMKENLTDEIGEVKDDLEEYVNAKLDLAKLHAAENISRFFSGMIIKMGIFYLLFFVLLFVSIAVAFWLNNIFSDKGIGFLIIAGFYLLCALIFFLLKKILVEKPIIKSFVQLFFPTFNNYDESK